jgi:PAS domain-containing protein
MPSGRILDSREALRARAEAEVQPQPEPGAAPPSRAAEAALLHELQVHQVELEMQNEELRRASVELEVSRDRYFDLYDLAPVGYLSLSERGVILEANLSSASLLREPRGALLRQPLSRFFLPEDAGTYFEHRRRLFASGERQACDLQLLTKAGAVSWVRLEMTAAKGPDGARQIRAALSDVSQRKLAERLLRDKAARLEAALAKLEALVDLLPVCPGCARMLDESGQWLELDDYLKQNAHAGRVRGLCGQCVKTAKDAT